MGVWGGGGWIGGMVTFHCYSIPTIQISVTFYFSFDCDPVCDRLHGLMKTRISDISDSLDFNFTFPLKNKTPRTGKTVINILLAGTVGEVEQVSYYPV